MKAVLADSYYLVNIPVQTLPQNSLFPSIKDAAHRGSGTPGKVAAAGPLPISSVEPQFHGPAMSSLWHISHHILLPLLTADITNQLRLSFLLSLNEPADSSLTQP